MRDAEPLLHRDDVAERLLLVRADDHRIAVPDEPGGAAEPLLGVREHLRTADGQTDCDLVRVVLAHVRRGVLGRAAAHLRLLDERDSAEAELRQEVRRARADDPGAQHDRISLREHRSSFRL